MMLQVAGPFPPAEGIDLLAWMQQATDGFTLSTAAPLLPLARNVGFCFACIRFIKTMLDGCIHAILGRPVMIAIDTIFCITRIAFINFVITYWVNVIPPFGVSFPDLFTKFGREVASIISLASLDMLLNQLNACWQGLEHPPLWNFFGLIVYYFVLVGMSLLDGALFFVMFIGFFAVALGKVFGSLIACFYLLPGYESKFHSLINYLWNYSMYRATAAGYTFVVATFMVHLFDSVVRNNYTLGHMAAIAVVFLAAIISTVVAAFKVPHFNVELWGGGHVGGEFGASIRNLLILVARKGIA